MFKVVYVARFRKDKTKEEVSAHWTDVHGPMGLKLPGFVGYTQNHMIGSIGPAGFVEAELPFDGYACEFWEDRETFERGMLSPEWAACVEDGWLLFDKDFFQGMSAALEQRIMREGERSPFKVVWFARFRSDIDRAEANDHWANVHGPIALKAPGIDRYVQNFVTGAIVNSKITDEPAAFDGFSECWFADEAAYVRAMESEAWAELVEDGHNFLDMGALTGMSGVIDERIIRLDPPAPEYVPRGQPATA
jgi:uncharacterized protein (TIGR02118 family)